MTDWINRERLLGSITPAQSAALGLFAVLGVLTAVLVPYGAGFDEEQHMRRAWEMAHLEFIPNESLGPELPIPAFLSEASYREQVIIRPVSPQDRERLAGQSLLDSGWIYDRAQTRSVYSPLLLLPQSLAVRYLGLKYELLAIHVVWGARLAGLFAYLLLIYVALRLIPFGRWLFLVFALTPTSLFQAATVTADALTNGIGLLFVAGALAVGRKQEAGYWDLAAVVALTALLFNGKLNLIPLVLLPLLLISGPQLGGRKYYLGLVGAVVSLLLVFVIGWYRGVYQDSRGLIGASSSFEQLAFILENPLPYFKTAVPDLVLLAPEAVRGAVAAYGYYYWQVPAFVYPFFGVAVLSALSADSSDASLQSPPRVKLVVVAAIVYAFTGIGLQLLIEPVGSVRIIELHGRYLTAILPLPFLAALKPGGWSRLTLGEWVPGLALGVSLSLFVVGLGLSYHVVCGSAYYDLGYCYQPQYKNWAPSRNLSDPVNESRPWRQEFHAECDGLSRIRLWIDASSADARGATDFTVGMLGEEEELAAVSVRNTDLPGGDWFYVDFERLGDSLGRTFWVEVRHRSSSERQGPRLGLTDRPEYRQGQLHVGSTAVKRDLFFQYGCTRGIQRLWANVRD